MTHHQLTFHKGPETYIWAYEPGQEPGVLDSLVDMAENRLVKFDMIDAAILALKVTREPTC